MKPNRAVTLGAFAVFCLLGSGWTAEPESFSRREDVVYGRKDGMALTFDVLTPKSKSNGAAVVWAISGGWFSSHNAIYPAFVPITDEKRVLEIARQISPIYQVSKDDPPTLIIHGDADTLVPIQQAEPIMARFKEAGVPAELVVKKGASHGWPNLPADMTTFADWFDKYLAKPQK